MFQFPKQGLVCTCFALLLAAAPAVAAEQEFISGDAHVEKGVITGTEEVALGAYSGPFDFDLDPDSGRFEGTATLDFGNGNTLTLAFVGLITEDGRVFALFEFVGGEGALKGAEGGGNFVGGTDGKTLDLSFEGMLRLP